MNQTKTSKALDHLHPSDLRGIAQLATQATGSVARMAEGVHQSVWRVMGAPGGPQRDQTRGLTGFVYRRVHDVTQLVGKGVDAALARLEYRDRPASSAFPRLASLVASLPKPLPSAFVAQLRQRMHGGMAHHRVFVTKQGH